MVLGRREEREEGDLQEDRRALHKRFPETVEVDSVEKMESQALKADADLEDRKNLSLPLGKGKGTHAAVLKSSAARSP